MVVSGLWLSCAGFRSALPALAPRQSSSFNPVYLSRARPTFLCVLGSIIGIGWPQQVFPAAENLSKRLNAIPESLWGLFGVGYLGHTSARSFDKWRGIDR